MKKFKLLVILATLICAITALCVCANAEIVSGTCGADGDNLTWTLDTSTGVLEIDGTGDMKNWSSSSSTPWYSYPSSIKTVTLGDGVTSIGSQAFQYCRSLESVDMPSVTSIDDAAFDSCDSLANVSMPCVTSIGNEAFAYCHSLESVDMPSVTSIGGWAFQYCSSLESVDMPCVTSVEKLAFYDCNSLASVDMPCVISIGYKAFADCSSLASVTIGESIENFGEYAFEGCDSLSDVYYNGDVVGWLNIEFGAVYLNPMSYGDNLYFGGKLVTDIVIPDGVTSIGDYAFYSCESLASVEIPASVTSISSSVFLRCTSLESITVDDANTYYSSDNFGVLFNKDKSTLIQYPIGNSRTEYTVPNSVTSIGDYAFFYCYSLASVDMPSVISIGEDAFCESSSLVSVDMPSVTSIGDYAFFYCYSLASVDMPSVTSIGEAAFYWCYSLASVDMPSVTSIGNYAFEDCDALTSVEISASVTSIGKYAFTYCPNLKKATVYSKTATFGSNVFKNTHADFAIHGYTGSTAQTYANANGHTFVPIVEREILAQGYCGGEGDGTNLSWILYADGELVISGNGKMKNWSDSSDVPWNSYRSSIKTVTLGESVTSIGNYAFYNCSSLASVEIPASVTSIGSLAFAECSSLASVDMPSVTSIGNYAFAYCDSLASVDMPSVTSIGDYAFYFCTALASVEMPSVTSIGWYAFGDCSSFESVEMPSVTSIGWYAFRSCDSLASVEIPASVTSIGDEAFEYCTSLKKAVIYSTTATFGSDVFNGTHADFEIHGYTGSTAETYANANNHPFVPLDAREILAQGYCGGEGDGTNLSWILYADGELVISGNGKMKNYASSASNRAPWYNYRTSIEVLTIEEGATTIGSFALYKCSAFTELSIPDSVITLGQYAFAECSSVERIYVGAGLATIGVKSLYNCTSLEYIEVDVDNTTYTNDEYGVLYNKAMTTLVQYPVGSDATAYTISANVSAISNYAFYGASSLKKAGIYTRTATFGTDVFKNTNAAFEIHGYVGSTAETYANANNHPFVSLECVEHDYAIDNDASYPATCTESGLNVYVCSKCGDSYTEFLGILEHDYITTPIFDSATCTQAGRKEYICRNCDTPKFEYSDALGHDMGDWEVVTPPTETEEGKERRDCQRDGCDYYETKTIPARNAVVVSVSSEKALVGSNVNVEIVIKNNSGFGGMSFDVEFDNTVLTLTAIDNLGSFANFVGTPINSANQNGSLSFVYAGVSNVVGDGKVATLTFAVSEDAEVGTLPLKVNVSSDSFVYDGYGIRDLLIGKEDGAITVINYISGDVDGNEDITIRDAALILQYLADWDVDINLDAADVDLDGKVGIRDAARILQYIAGWDVTLG